MHCIEGLESRGESVSVGDLQFDIEEAEEQEISCEWCGEVDDLYDCELGESKGGV
jgi:hypothetical protein